VRSADFLGKPFRAGESGTGDGASSGAAAWTLTMVTGGALLFTRAGCYLSSATSFDLANESRAIVCKRLASGVTAHPLSCGSPQSIWLAMLHTTRLGMADSRD
jgi:hypothetical protein